MGKQKHNVQKPIRRSNTARVSRIRKKCDCLQSVTYVLTWKSWTLVVAGTRTATGKPKPVRRLGRERRCAGAAPSERAVSPSVQQDDESIFDKPGRNNSK